MDNRALQLPKFIFRLRANFPYRNTRTSILIVVTVAYKYGMAVCMSVWWYILYTHIYNITTNSLIVLGCAPLIILMADGVTIYNTTI